jgi:hypothetical protein
VDIGYLVGSALGRAFLSTLITFAFAALAIQTQRKAKLGSRNAVTFFGIAFAIVSVVNVGLYLAVPTLLTDSAMTPLGLLQFLGLPFAVSVLVLRALWKPKLS